jgi:phosphoenolpyruvate carboxykinase (GTP)
VGNKLKSPPEIFHVNWFRQDEAGKFLWPGFGDNMRVLRWIIDRCKGTVGARTTPIGFLPGVSDLDVEGLGLAPAALNELLAVNPTLWSEELAGVSAYMDEFGERLPRPLKAELVQAQRRIQAERP